MNADDEITTISRPLTCEECSRHKQVVGIMQRKGPFQPYWETLMLQATVYQLEIRDVWQIALLTIPDELRLKLTAEMKLSTSI